jgi:hypothetical protein
VSRFSLSSAARCKRADKSNAAAAVLSRASVGVLEVLERRTLFSTIYVTNGQDESGGNPVAGSLRAAIVAADATAGSTISFAQLPAGTVITLDASLATTPVTAAGTIIDGTTATSGRITINGAGLDGLNISGGTTTIQGLWLQDMGTALTLDASDGDVIQNNYIGDVNDSGKNQNQVGIAIIDGSENDTIGGTAFSDANVISGNNNSAKTGAGILLYTLPPSAGGTAATAGNLIENNYIGVTPGGTAAAPNNFGIELQASHNTIQNNVISGNTAAAISDTDPSGDGYEYDNTIELNIVGLDYTATNPIPDGAGFLMDGGDLSGGNLIELNTIQSNTGVGIEVNEGSDNSYLGYVSGGDYIAQNIIDNNGGTGVVIETGTENTAVFQNSIFLNGSQGAGYGLGIDLGNDGVTQNSLLAGTTATGPNGLQPFPVIGTITPDSGDSTMLTVPFTLTANPSTNYIVEIFASQSADASKSSYGQGQVLVGDVQVTTDSTGAASGSLNISASTFAGLTISATASNASAYNANVSSGQLNLDSDATSEFTANKTAPGVELPEVGITNAAGSVGGNVVFPVTLSSASNTPTTVSYTYTTGAPSNSSGPVFSSAPLSDITSTSGTLTIAPGATRGTISVPIVADSTGGIEQFTITLSNLSANAEFTNLLSTETAVGTINPATSTGATNSTTTLVAAPTSTVAGANVALTATVSGGSTTPTGTVTFYDGTTVIGTAAVNGSGIALLDTTALPVGVNSITAVYSGNSTYSPSTSNAVNVTITGSTQKSSTITLVATPTSGGVGTTITLTATVSGAAGIATGTVQFSDNGTIIGTAPLNAQGKAVLTTSTLPVGADGLTATYLGSGTYLTSTSGTVIVTITAIGTGTSVTTLVASPVSAPQGSGITLTATVASSPSGGPTPTGVVTFVYNGSSIGTAILNAQGQATLVVTTLPIGADGITATYPGDSTYAGSSSSPTTVTITQPLTDTTTTVTASATTVPYGDPVTLTATISHNSGAATPTGTVTFVENGTVLGTAPVGSGGTASLTVSTLAAGYNPVIADYSGDVNYLFSYSHPFSVLVTSTANTALSVSTNSVIVADSKVLLSANVVPATAGGATPTGTVTFYQNGTTVLGTVELQSDGSASLTTTSLGVGSDNITAVYGGTPVYPVSSSSPVTLTVLNQANDKATVATTVSLATVVGNTVTLTTTVSPTTAGGPTPTGTVSFFTNGALIGTATLQSNGTAVLTTTELEVGNNEITAFYSGNSLYTPSAPGSAAAFVNTLGLVPAITKSSIPSAIIAGTPTHGAVTVTLTNVTAQMIREPQTTIHLYASADGTIDSNSVLIQQWITNVKVKAGKVQSFKLNVKNLPASMASGTYTLMIRVSNTLGTFGYFFEGPTIQVTAARIAFTETLAAVNLPTTVVSGDNNGGDAEFVLTNNGNFTSAGPIRIDLTISSNSGQLGTTLKTVIVSPTIAPGQSRTIKVPLGTLPALAGGSYYLVAEVTDPLGATSLVSSPLSTLIVTSFG